jgi:putative FmdB family regulatory protein
LYFYRHDCVRAVQFIMRGRVKGSLEKAISTSISGRFHSGLPAMIRWHVPSSLGRRLELPLYEYRCLKCDRHTDKIENMNGPHLKKCPHCGGKVESVITAPSIQFKGTGWYVTDYGKGGPPDAGRPDTKKTSDAAKTDSTATPSTSSSDGASSDSASSKSSSESSSASTSTPASGGIDAKKSDS